MNAPTAGPSRDSGFPTKPESVGQANTGMQQNGRVSGYRLKKAIRVSVVQDGWVEVRRTTRGAVQSQRRIVDLFLSQRLSRADNIAHS